MRFTWPIYDSSINKGSTSLDIDSSLGPSVGASNLFSSIQRTLRSNLDRILSVSGDREGEATKLSQRELSEATGVARSTIIKLLSADASQANPDLWTLCRLASVLKIPPAFLLMTAQDWSRLESAINGLAYVPELFEGEPSVQRLSTRDVAQRALSLAENVLPQERFNNPFDHSEGQEDQRYQFEIEQKQKRQQVHQSIKAMAVAPAWASISGDAETIFSLCTLMGAATQL